MGNGHMSSDAASMQPNMVKVASFGLASLVLVGAAHDTPPTAHPLFDLGDTNVPSVYRQEKRSTDMESLGGADNDGEDAIHMSQAEFLQNARDMSTMPAKRKHDVGEPLERLSMGHQRHTKDLGMTEEDQSKHAEILVQH